MGFVMSFIKIRHQPMGRQVCLTMPSGRLHSQQNENVVGLLVAYNFCCTFM